MKKMYKELFLFKWALLLLILTVIGSVAANLALPMYLSEVINTAIPAGDKVRIVSIGGTMLLFVLLGVLCSVGTGFFASLASVGFGRNVRSRIFRKVQYYSQTEFDGFSTSSLITRTNNDVVQVQTFMNMLLKVCLMAPVMCIGGVVLALAKSVTMSMILIVSLPVMIAFVLIIARLASPLSRKMQEKLDEIMLKHIIEEVDRQVAAYQAAECGEPVDPGDRERVKSAKVPIPGILIDAPLLFEAGLADRCDRILLVTADLDARIRRVCARDQVSEQAVRDRISCQMSEEEKKKRSDLIVDNSGTREELEKQLKSLLFSDPF